MLFCGELCIIIWHKEAYQSGRTEPHSKCGCRRNSAREFESHRFRQIARATTRLSDKPKSWFVFFFVCALASRANCKLFAPAKTLARLKKDIFFPKFWLLKFNFLLIAKTQICQQVSPVKVPFFVLVLKKSCKFATLFYLSMFVFSALIFFA